MLDSFRCFALKHLALQTANILETVQGCPRHLCFCQISSSRIPYKSIQYGCAKRCQGLPCRPDRALLNHPLGCPRLSQQQSAQMHALIWPKTQGIMMLCSSFRMNLRYIPIPCSFLVSMESMGLYQEDLGSHTLPLSTCHAWSCGQFDCCCSLDPAAIMRHQDKEHHSAPRIELGLNSVKLG